MGRAWTNTQGFKRAREVARFLDAAVERIAIVSWLVIIAAILSLMWFAADRSPPFEIKTSPVAAVRAGEWLKITADVRRDAHRGCDAVYSWYIFGGDDYVRYNLGTYYASARMINTMEVRNPGKLPIAILVPASIEPGPARLEMVISYRCNKVHALWPIVVTAEIPFTVVE